MCGLALAACSSVEPADAVKAAVHEYNRQLARGFSQLDMTSLAAVATEDQAAEEYLLMAALGEGGVVMHATLRSLEFEKVAFPERGRARVATAEVWDYDHVSLDTSETVRSERGVTYRLRYDLVLRDERWLVADVTSLDETSGTQSDAATPARPLRE